MADYLVQEDGVSHLLLEDGSGGILLEASAAAVVVASRHGGFGVPGNSLDDDIVAGVLALLVLTD